MRHCPDCRHRAALLAALAPAIERLEPLTRQSLLCLLALDDEQLHRAVAVTDTRGTLRRARAAHPARGAPTELCRHEPGYPLALAQLDSAPAVLHATCEPEQLFSLLAAPTVAIVGDRSSNGYAQEVTFALASELARAGMTVISGLNQGLEGAAHHGALHAGGQTIAVMGCAPEYPYPRQQDHLHRRILARGAAVSEFPPGFHPPRRWCFIASQRIIAALASVVVVVEAGERSIALFTTQIASDLGHDVAVVPRRATEPGGLGTFGLLRDGAHPVSCARDVLDVIGGTEARRAPNHISIP
jgi:DNA processing protein